MDCIPEENLAFDNKSYISVNFPPIDSGLDSYEEVKTFEAPSYENIEEECYEKIEPPLNYQNIEFVPPPPMLMSLPNLNSEEGETYENLKFNSLTPPKSPPIYATPNKTPKIEESPVYENYDFQEQAIYQNIKVEKSGKMMPVNSRRLSAPAKPSTSDVYAQVKMLRRSVQEVNAMLEPSKRSELVRQRTKELSISGNNTNFVRRSSNTASVKRSSNFKSILNKFNVMSTDENALKK